MPNNRQLDLGYLEAGHVAIADYVEAYRIAVYGTVGSLRRK